MAFTSIISRKHRGHRGFTLIELLAVVAILGILATIAIGAYARQVRNAHKSEILADLSNLTLRQKTFLSVNGHYASSATQEGPAFTYPTGAEITDASGEVQWEIDADGYTGASLTDGAYARGGPALHGFDALRFMPEGGNSFCGYATISGWGSNAIDPEDPDATLDEEPPGGILADEIFQAGSDNYYASDWYFSYALCDFDHDGDYWAFTGAHYTSDIIYTTNTVNSPGTYRESE